MRLLAFLFTLSYILILLWDCPGVNAYVDFSLCSVIARRKALTKPTGRHLPNSDPAGVAFGCIRNRRYRRLPFLTFSRKEDDYRDDSLLFQDRTGHINRKLAETLFHWEIEHRKLSNLPPLDYSMRAGLRLVDQLSKKLLEEKRQDSAGSPSSTMDKQNKNGRTPTSKNRMLYSELVQEGLTALLDALRLYDHESSPSLLFEDYARSHILTSMVAALDQARSRPMRLPTPLIRRAKLIKRQLSQEGQREVSWDDVARHMNIPAERLLQFLNLDREAVSFESTVQVSHPLLDDSKPVYRDRDAWEVRQGLVLDDYKDSSVRSSGRLSMMSDQTLVEDYLDEMTNREGDDDSWIQQQEQVAGSLQDLIPDDQQDDENDNNANDNSLFSSSLSDDIVLQEMIQSDLSNFLTDSLNSEEVRILRLVFGLDNGQQMSVSRVSRETELSSGHVLQVLRTSIRKLRESYTSRYHQIDQDDADGEKESGSFPPSTDSV